MNIFTEKRTFFRFLMDLGAKFFNERDRQHQTVTLVKKMALWVDKKSGKRDFFQKKCDFLKILNNSIDICFYGKMTFFPVFDGF